MRLTCKSIALLVIASVFHIASGEVKYRIEELAAPPESEIRVTQIQALRTNNRGQILANVFGYLPDGRDAVRPYLYENGVPKRLEVASTYKEIYAGMLNNNGLTLCEQYHYKPTFPYEYLIHQDGKYVTTLDPMKTIGYNDLADDGTFVGTYDVNGPNGTLLRKPATYKDGVRKDLETFGGIEGSALGTNNRGQIVGWATNGAGYAVGCIWENGSIGQLTWNGLRVGPMVISDSGFIGGSRTINTELDQEIFVMRGNSYTGYSVSNEFQYFLSGINDEGIAVCARLRNSPFILDGAMVFSGGKAQLLEDISDAKTKGWIKLTGATDINNNGEIVGWGSKNGKMRGYIARPVPEPATWLAMVGGTILLVRIRRRQT